MPLSSNPPHLDYKSDTFSIRFRSSLNTRSTLKTSAIWLLPTWVAFAISICIGIENWRCFGDYVVLTTSVSYLGIGLCFQKSFEGSNNKNFAKNTLPKVLE